MRITQVFASADNERVISELEILPDQGTSVPVVGDNVRWITNDKVYTGRVKSRLISYSEPNNIGLDSTEHDFCSASKLYRVTMQLEPVDDESVLVEPEDESV